MLIYGSHSIFWDIILEIVLNSYAICFTEIQLKPTNMYVQFVMIAWKQNKKKNYFQLKVI